MFIDLRERERASEHNHDIRKDSWLVASYILPNQGLNPQPKYVP